VNYKNFISSPGIQLIIDATAKKRSGRINMEEPLIEHGRNTLRRRSGERGPMDGARVTSRMDAESERSPRGARQATGVFHAESW
jgi:hypothetical protein